jgi:hypothetical protein
LTDREVLYFTQKRRSLGHFTLITATILAHISGSALFRRARKEMHNEKEKKKCEHFNQTRGESTCNSSQIKGFENRS